MRRARGDEKWWLDQVGKGCSEGLNGRKWCLEVQNKGSVVYLPKLQYLIEEEREEVDDPQ